MIIAFTPLTNFIFRGAVGRLFYKMIDSLLWGLVWFYEQLGLVKYTTDLSTTHIARARVLWEEAKKRGIKMEGAVFSGRYSDLYRAWINGKMIRFNGLPRPEYAENSNLFALDDKAFFKQQLQTAGIPTPNGGCFTNLTEATKEFNKLIKPVIIKPRLGSRGRHTTTHIYTTEQLAKAFKIAKQICYWIVMEEHLFGDVYRGTVIDGKLVGVLGGSPPRLVGDGSSTISELIKQKNLNKPAGIKNIQISQSTEEFLKRQNLTLNSILNNEQIIDLTEKIGVNYGGSSREVTDITHPEIKSWLAKAAALVGDPLLGFDFIIPNITKSPNEQRFGIIECNGLPFINLHHDPQEGTPNNVAKWVWNMIEKSVNEKNNTNPKSLK